LLRPPWRALTVPEIFWAVQTRAKCIGAQRDDLKHDSSH
jgi:hypothetical protein